MRIVERWMTLMLALLMAGCGEKKVGSIEEFNGLVKKVQKKNEEIGEINKEIMDAVRQFNANRKADDQLTIPDTMLGLNQDQLKKIQDMVEKEQDLTYRGLLTQIIDKDKQIDRMAQELNEIKARLPKPHAVKMGDSHYDVCMEYLTREKNLPRDKAAKFLEETALIDELRDGFNIWLYYDDKEGVFGTFVTQGTARISPNQFKYTIRKMQLEAAKESGKEEAMKEMQKAPGDTMARP